MIKRYKIKKFRRINGYTIIETMVAISIFLVVVIYGMGAFLNANLVNKKSQDTRSIMDNLSFIMEDMGRNLRTGYNYHCIVGNDDLSNLSAPKSGQGCWGIAFESATGDTTNPNDQWVYYVDNTGKVFRSTEGPYTNQANFIQLTPDEVVVSSSSLFSVLGAKSFKVGDKQQPYVSIKLSGKITLKNLITPFSLQTSISQRLLDI